LALGLLAHSFLGAERAERAKRDVRQSQEALGYGHQAYQDVLHALQAGDFSAPTVRGATVGGLLREMAEKALAGELMAVSPAASSRLGNIYFDPTEGMRAVLGLTRQLGIPAATLTNQELADIIVGMGEPRGRFIDQWGGRGRWQALFDALGGPIAAQYPQLLEGVPPISQDVILAPIEREVLNLWGYPENFARNYVFGEPAPLQRWHEALLRTWGYTPEQVAEWARQAEAEARDQMATASA